MNRLAQLEAENKALQVENARLRSSNQSTIGKLEKRLAIEATHKESRHRFKTIFEQSKLGKKIITDDLRIIQVNKALQHMLGYSKKELVDTKITAYAHPDFVHTWDLLQRQYAACADKISICILSSSSAYKDKLKSLEYPISGYLTKPLTTEKLMPILEGL